MSSITHKINDEFLNQLLYDKQKDEYYKNESSINIFLLLIIFSIIIFILHGIRNFESILHNIKYLFGKEYIKPEMMKKVYLTNSLAINTIEIPFYILLLMTIFNRKRIVIDKKEISELDKIILKK